MKNYNLEDFAKLMARDNTRAYHFDNFLDLNEVTKGDLGQYKGFTNDDKSKAVIFAAIDGISDKDKPTKSKDAQDDAGKASETFIHVFVAQVGRNNKMYSIAREDLAGIKAAFDKEVAARGYNIDVEKIVTPKGVVSPEEAEKAKQEPSTVFIPLPVPKNDEKLFDVTLKDGGVASGYRKLEGEYELWNIGEEKKSQRRGNSSNPDENRSDGKGEVTLGASTPQPENEAEPAEKLEGEELFNSANLGNLSPALPQSFQQESSGAFLG